MPPSRWQSQQHQVTRGVFIRGWRHGTCSEIGEIPRHTPAPPLALQHVNCKHKHVNDLLLISIQSLTEPSIAMLPSSIFWPKVWFVFFGDLHEQVYKYNVDCRWISSALLTNKQCNWLHGTVTYKMHKRWELFLIFKKSDNIAHNLVQLWNISQSRGAFLRWRTYYVRPPLPSTPRPPAWPHWGCPPPAGRWNKVPPLLACSPPQGCTLVPQSATTTTTPTTLWTAATFLLLSVSLPTLLVLSVWRPWNLAWPSSGAHKCGSFRAGPQILSKLSKK